nr:MAG TPA: hypothetical protein [Caudoviricetes sp.]
MILTLLIIILLTCIFTVMNDNFTITKLIIHLMINILAFLVYLLLFFIIVVI